jgi:septum site-determining protein MinC
MKGDQAGFPAEKSIGGAAMSGENSANIVLKGAVYGIRMIFPEQGSEDGLLSELERLFSESSVLSGDMQIVLDFQGRKVSRYFIQKLLSDYVWSRRMRILSWISLDGETQDDLRCMGVATGEPLPEKTEKRERTSGGALLLNRSLRSGQRVEHEGDVILVGHVNDGAEIIASGNICVWGRLKGVAHAGLDGQEDRTLVAGQFEARQVRIGSKVSSSLGSEMEWWGKPVIITMENSSLVVRELQL